MLLTASILVGKVYGEQVLILNKKKQIVSIGNKNVIFIETCPLPLEAAGCIVQYGTGALLQFFQIH